MERFKEPFLHPILFSLYPVAALLAFNVAEIRPSAGLRSTLIAILGAIVLFWILKLLIQDPHRAGLATSFVVIFIFSYGHIYSSLKETEVMGITLGRHRLLALLSLTILGMAL